MLKPLNKCLRAVRETIQLIQDIGKMSRGFIRGTSKNSLCCSSHEFVGVIMRHEHSIRLL